MRAKQLTPLLVRMPNWIGDCMMALPTLHYLEKQGYELTLVGKPWLNDLFADAWPVIQYSDKKDEKLDLIRNHPATDMLLFTNSFSSARHAKQAKKKAIGYKGHYRRFLLHKKFSAYANLHEANHFLKLAQLYLSDVLSNDPLIAFALPRKATNHLTELRAAVIEKFPELQKPFILLCPFAIGTNKAGASKVWPYWEELLAYLNTHYPIYQLVTCPHANECCDPIIQNKPYLHIIKNIHLDEYFACMEMAKIVIGNDTGPMHMSACVNPQSYTLFGATDPARTKPLKGLAIGKHGEWPTLEQVIEQLKLNL